MRNEEFSTRTREYMQTVQEQISACKAARSAALRSNEPEETLSEIDATLRILTSMYDRLEVLSDLDTDSFM